MTPLAAFSGSKSPVRRQASLRPAALRATPLARRNTRVYLRNGPLSEVLRVETEAGPHRRPAQRRQRGWWLLAGRKLTQQLGGGSRDVADGDLDGLRRRRRGFLHTTDLAHVLQGGRLDLLRGGGWVESSQGRDVAAHTSTV